jgi:cytochrome c oxidase assembly protein subunit 15
LVTVAGATVRASGSGMGCPDWPLCFGRLVPPTAMDQLPKDYQSLHQVAGRSVSFNVWYAWIEYTNRLLGVATGILLLTQFIWACRTGPRRLFWLAAASLLLVITEALVGASVVATYLKSWIVTIHLFLALVLALVQLRLLLVARSFRQVPAIVTAPSWLGWLWLTASAVTVGQLVLGTRLRELAETAPESYDQPTAAGLAVATLVTTHVIVAVLVCLLTVWLASYLVAGLRRPPAKIIGLWLFVVLGIQLASGLILQALGRPDLVKPVHVLGSTTLFVIQFLVRWLFIKPLRSAL